MPSYQQTTVVTKSLTAAVANGIATLQLPVSGTPINLNGSLVTTGVATLDTGRRVQIAINAEAAPRTMTLIGTNSGGATITEVVSIPQGTATTLSSYNDFATVTAAIPGGGGWTGNITLGTNTTGSTMAQVPAHYAAVFTLAFDITAPTGYSMTTTPNFAIECTRDIPYPMMSIYNPGQSVAPTPVNWFAWPTFTAITPAPANFAEWIGDIDSPVNAWRLTMLLAGGPVTVRATPVGLRT